MKKKISLIFLIVFFFMANIVNAVNNSYENNENIRNYDIEIHVNEDSSMEVTEKITVYANGKAIKHGIYRDFPTEYENKKVRFEVKEVLLDENDVNYEVSTVERGARIKIGDEDSNVTKGLHTYTIKYTTERQMTFYEDFDELYWNVIGSGWNFSIEHCHAKVYFPEGTKFINDKLKTFTGKYGNKESEINVNYNILPNENSIEFDINETLDKYNAFTISVFIEKGAINEPTTSQKVKWFIEDNIISIIMFVVLVFLVIWQFFCWKKCGVDPKPNVIIPRYYPPKGMLPADIKYLSTMGSMTRVLEASIINLAVKGYFKFTKKSEKSSKIIIEKTDKTEGLQELEELEKVIYDSFKDKETLQYSSSLQSKLASLQININTKLSNKYRNKLFFINANKIGFSIGISIFAFVFAIIVGMSINEFATQRYFERLLFLIPIVIFAIDNLIFIKLVRRYNEKGLRLKEEIDGFKMFIDTAKDDDFKDKTPEMFDKYFPYAYVLGLENKWASKFEDVLKSAEYAPTWCSPYMYHDGIFDAIIFTHAFSSSFSSGMSSASTAPTSSGGSIGSGGGFSGGGGGGRRTEEAGNCSPANFTQIKLCRMISIIGSSKNFPIIK